MLVDSHAHLDMSPFTCDLGEVLERARGAQITHILSIGTDLASSHEAISLSERYAEVFAAVGFHPHDAAKMEEADLKEMARLCRHPRVVAIGEIGLDYYRNLSPRAAQMEAFRRQLDLAAELGLPVIVHSREAATDTTSVLSEWASRTPGVRGVLHCFSGDLAAARRYIDLGFFISIAGPVTYPRSGRLAEVARNIELDRMLVETDCPFLTPAPLRGQRNEPAFITHTVEKIAQLRDTTPEAVARQTARNAAALFGLPDRKLCPASARGTS
ncbi:MAG: TatD family hydrolase [Chloroflexi bacterium]|nr:TatD family hydrolase [Chloroflexota bacterium]